MGKIEDIIKNANRFRAVGKEMGENYIVIQDITPDLHTLTCTVYRNGRSDEEIDTLMRKYKISIMVIYKDMLPDDPSVKLRYKVTDSIEEWKKAAKDAETFVNNYDFFSNLM